MHARFTITYDYLCPFARVANEAVAEALNDGADYEVLFAPFSLHQNSLGSDGIAVWDDPDGANGPGVQALLWSLAVRDAQPERFLAFHVALFSARHDAGSDLTEVDVLRAVADGVGVDTAQIEEVVASGSPMDNLRTEHSWLVEEFDVFGVPTFIAGDEAVFVRLMERHRRDDLERVLALVNQPNINEFKRTRIPR